MSSHGTDPSDPARRRQMWWVGVFLLTTLLFGPGFLESLRPADGQIFDFFKEWAAVRNRQTDMPVYSNQRIAVERHLGITLPKNPGFFDEYNTHPPSANLIAVPFASLSYWKAHQAWNLLSVIFLVGAIWLVLRQGEESSGIVGYLSVISVLLVCDPLRQSVFQGQPNLLLLLLITGTWIADRHERPVLAGALLAVASAIKIYPAFVFLYFLVQRNGRAFVGGCLGAAFISVATVAVFGFQCYRDYFVTALPALRGVTNNWGNTSILSFWERLFGESTSVITTLMPNRTLLLGLVLISIVAILTFLVIAIYRARTRNERDVAFSLVVTAMLLVSPTTWSHYFIVLLPVAFVAMRETSTHRLSRFTLYFALAALTLSPRFLWRPLFGNAGGGAVVSVPWQSLTALSYHTYALIALLAVLRRRGNETKTVIESPPAQPT